MFGFGCIDKMKEVYALTDLHDIEGVGRFLGKHYGEQMLDVWDLGLQLALRISDLLSIKISDIKNDKVELVESKTGKLAVIHLNSKAIGVINRIRVEHPESTYLFQSNKSRNLNGRVKPISRQAVTKAFAEAGDALGIRLGTHSMRKTRGYWLYKKTNDIARVMKMLRHGSEAVTLRYIGITQEQVDNDFEELII
jgi:integrase